MYNLLVSADDEEWEGNPFKIEIGRCVREYTDDFITEQFGELNSSAIEKIKGFPSIFAYESFNEKDPKFGLLTKIRRKSNGSVRIEYQIHNLKEFLTASQLKELSPELDIGKLELNRTHWAIKEVDLGLELSKKSITLPAWAQRSRDIIDIAQHSFLVSLSFPGEARSYVEKVVDALEKFLGPNTYFYDNNYTAQLAQPGLDNLLQDIYRNRSKLIVVFLSEDYQKKEWCGIEFRAIKEIIFEKENRRIMFIRLDESKIDGVFKTDGYLDANRFQPLDIAHFIQERLEILP